MEEIILIVPRLCVRQALKMKVKVSKFSDYIQHQEGFSEFLICISFHRNFLKDLKVFNALVYVSN